MKSWAVRPPIFDQNRPVSRALCPPPNAAPGIHDPAPETEPHHDRLERLREAGPAEPALARLCSPLGLDLGARTPEETAISVAAEIIAARSNATGRPLTGTSGPIHR